MSIKSPIPFTQENARKCLCPSCPVQAASQCVKEKKSAISAALKQNPLKPEDIPGMYCTTGIAICDGLDKKQSCTCPFCQVYKQHSLKGGSPKDYYCTIGKAK